MGVSLHLVFTPGLVGVPSGHVVRVLSVTPQSFASASLRSVNHQDHGAQPKETRVVPIRPR